MHLQRVAKERDRQYDTLNDIIQERDYYRAIHQAGVSGSGADEQTDSVLHENGLTLTAGGTPVKSPGINTDVLELKKKCRQLQEQL